MFSNEELETAKKLKNDFEFYARKCLKVRPKEGEIRPFIMNSAQKFIHSRVEEQLRKTRKIRAIILKGRQLGCTTYIQGRFYHKVTHNFGVSAFILTHEDQATQNLYKMAQRYHEHCDPAVKPSIKASNARELSFDALDSGYALGTAGNKSVGRSSTIQYLHASEAAFYQHADEHAKGILQTVPFVDNTEIFIESTANGVGNWFHRQWLAAEAGNSEFIAIFVPWFWQEEYRKPVGDKFSPTDEELQLQFLYNLTNEQLNWRRMKIIELGGTGANGEREFRQEYPNNATEAFLESGEEQIFIPSAIVAKARINNTKAQIQAVGPLIIGADIARFGDDRTAFIRRKGRVAYGLEVYKKIDTMESAGRLHKIIIEEKPARVFIDLGAMGAGVYDRLVELGHKDIVVGINFGSKPLAIDRYGNKRDEMWGLTKEWFLDEPVVIPDSQSLHSDLCTVRYRVGSKSEVIIESKEQLKDKKRLGRSPDEADALVLTFAMPVESMISNNQNDEKLASQIMRRYKQSNSKNTW